MIHTRCISLKYTHYTPKRVKQPDRPRWRLPVLLAAVLVSLGLLMAPNGEAHVAEALPPATPSPHPPHLRTKFFIQIYSYIYPRNDGNQFPTIDSRQTRGI